MKTVLSLAGAAAAIVTFAFFLYAAQAHKCVAAQATEQHTGDVAAWKTQAPLLMADIRLGNLSPYGFQRLCGRPSMRINRTDFFALFYEEQNVVVMFHHRMSGTQQTEASRQNTYAPYDQASFWEINPRQMLTPEAALEALRCKLPDDAQ
jgi:hypothetical protein